MAATEATALTARVLPVTKETEYAAAKAIEVFVATAVKVAAMKMEVEVVAVEQ